MIKVVKDDTKKNNENKKINDKKEENKEEVIAKKITGDDLKKQNKTLIWLASIFTGLVIVVTLIFVMIMSTSRNATIEVPDVSNKTVDEAIRILQDIGFEISDEQEGVSSKEIEVGNIVKTSPSRGTKRKKGAEIKLYVSTGDETILIEDYKNKSYLEVKGSLEARGLIVNVIPEIVEDDKEFKANEVVSQDVEAGTSLKKGQSITIYYAVVGITYPDFTDGTYTISDVEEFCETYGLKLNIIETTDNSHLAGTIYYQNRTPNDPQVPVTEGAKLTIKVYINAESDEPIEDSCTDEDRELGNC